MKRRGRRGAGVEMAAAQTNDDFRERLGVEVAGWVRDGLISEEQSRAILSRYGLRASTARAVRLGPVATLLSVLGAIVLGTGVVYFFAANWEALPDWFKVALVFTATGLAYTSGYVLRYVWKGLPRVGDALILLGAILFQAGIFLLEQIYNMPVDNPTALLLGAAGIVPLAYALGARLVLVLGLLDGLAWLGWELGDRYPDSPRQFVVPLMLILAGVLVYAAASWHRLRGDGARFAPVYEMLGLFTILVPAYVLSFGDVWDSASRHDLASLHVPVWFVGAVGAAIAASVSTLIKRDDQAAVRVQAGVLVVVALSAALPAFARDWAGIYPLLFNLVYFGVAMLACVYGYLHGQARFVNAGIPVLALGLITRYFDTFWGLLPHSAFYVTAGVVIIGVAAGLERLRQRLLQAAEAAA